MSEAPSALAGLVVVERAGRIATAACASLLAALGARVLRVEAPDEERRLTQASYPEQLLRAGGKERIQLTHDGIERERAWRRLHAAADVLIFDPPHPESADHAFLQSLVAKGARDKVICAISPAGLQGSALPVDAGDPLVQAVSGVMAVTGHDGGRPEFVRVPVSEMSAAVLATTAILAALRVRDRHGVGQLIDLSLIEVMADQLRTHLPKVMSGQPRGFRLGCRSPIASPWNVYRARDGWVLVCSASDSQWQGMLDVIGRADLKQEPRFADVTSRCAHTDEVDALMQAWAEKHGIEQVVTAISACEAPVGPALSIPQAVADSLLQDLGTVRTEHSGARSTQFVAGSALHLSRTPMRFASMPTAVTNAIPRDLPAGAERTRTRSEPGAPLQGVRVIELSRYAAGPLTGVVLASLGAEVIKIESPRGEDCRGWMPQFGGLSGYFVNYNSGKRSVTLDLRQTEGRKRLRGLIADADVLLQNLRPGVMERIGFGPGEVTAQHPGIVYGSISGFGLAGPKLAALDTVIQGRLGLTALVGDGRVPLRMGFSIADQLAGHFAAAGIVAALAERERSGRGQVVDVAMADAIAWLTQLAWPDGKPAIGPTSQWEARDGWVVADTGRDAVLRALRSDATKEMLRAELVLALAGHGIRAAPVLEADEVLTQPLIETRASLYQIKAGGDAMAPVLAVPLGLTLTPVLRPHRMHLLGEDNAQLLHDPDRDATEKS
ncbi:MAG: CoA transferase [Betaproteobacteria bacterium]|nr:CoA transferase [Betaproteobacteria bacterium]